MAERSSSSLSGLSIEQLQEKCMAERRRADHLEEELRHAREQNVIVQRQAEQEEEAITLKLMRRLEQLKNEKAVLATEVEREEEFLTNTLQKRLAKLAAEKEELEVKLNDLKKQTEQLDAEKARLAKEKIDLEATLEHESEYIVNRLQVQLDKLGAEKKNLSLEKQQLQQQCTELKESVNRLNHDKVRLEQDMEMEEESIVNRLQRQLELLLHNIKLIEQRLDARGISMKDLGIAPADLAASETMRIYSRSPSTSSDRYLPSPYASGQLLGSSPTSMSLAHRSRGHIRSSGGTASGELLLGSRSSDVALARSSNTPVSSEALARSSEVLARPSGTPVSSS